MNVDKLFEAIADKLPKNTVKIKDNIELHNTIKPDESSNCQRC